MKLFIAIAVPVALLAGAVAVNAATDAVAYPQGYRQWQHVKSMVIQPGHPLHASFGGIHHLYANDRAQAGYRTGKFPDGAVIVFDLLDVNAADSAITEGKRKVVGVMARRQEIRCDRRLGLRGIRGRQPDREGRGRQSRDRLLYLSYRPETAGLRLQQLPGMTKYPAGR